MFGSNVISHGGRLTKKMPVELIEQPSRIDGRPCLAVIYPPESRFPWPWVIDELRLLDDERLLAAQHLLGGQQVLGMTLVTRRPLNKLALPFLLTHTMR